MRLDQLDQMTAKELRETLEVVIAEYDELRNQVTVYENLLIALKHDKSKINYRINAALRGFNND